MISSHALALDADDDQAPRLGDLQFLEEACRCFSRSNLNPVSFEDFCPVAPVIDTRAWPATSSASLK